ncbi:MAG: hypothetical protein GF308_09145 [Candidatus Heimdallarchaeota archaeon]|nr:hypothetical protein [Candidatus Heimdallarchaeota archaeon]
MKKAIVLYNSRGGNTEKVAMKIAEGLGAECRNHRQIPDLKDYELIVVGSWMMMGRISFAGARLLRKIRRKAIAGKKFALFFTAGGPDEIHHATENTDEPKTYKEIMFESMEKRLSKDKQITILPERFYTLGTLRMPLFGVEENPGHPSEEELAQAKAFGEQLKKQLEP